MGGGFPSLVYRSSSSEPKGHQREPPPPYLESTLHYSSQASMYRSSAPGPARVRIYNEAMASTLLDPEVDETYAPSPDRDNAPSPSRTAEREEELATIASFRRERANQKKKELQDLEEQRQRRYDRNRSEARAKAAEEERRVKEAVMVSELKRETDYQGHFGSIGAGRRLAAEIKARQDLEDEAERNKKVRQFEEWNLNVYGKIQERVGGSSTL